MEPKSNPVSVARLRIDAEGMWVDLADGRKLRVPLSWFPRLMCAATEQSEPVTISTRGLHWDAPPEHVSIEGMVAGLAGRPVGPRIQPRR